MPWACVSTSPWPTPSRATPGDSLRLASLAAMDKGDSTFRVLHDGTHGVRVNNDTQPRDQTRMPSAGELRRVLEHARSIGGLHFSLQSDVHKAHRRFKNAQRDWGYQACQVFEGTVWLNRVGTFGVGTACYWWARLAACLARAGLTVTDLEELWQLLFADDVLWIAAGPNFVDLILSCLFTWTLFGTPFKWVKCRGGLQQDWLGYWLDLETFSLIKWINEVLTAGSVLVRTFVEALERFGFAAGVLEWDRPFLGPLYSWAAALPMSTYLRLPVLITPHPRIPPRSVGAWCAGVTLLAAPERGASPVHGRRQGGGRSSGHRRLVLCRLRAP